MKATEAIRALEGLIKAPGRLALAIAAVAFASTANAQSFEVGGIYCGMDGDQGHIFKIIEVDAREAYMRQYQPLARCPGALEDSMLAESLQIPPAELGFLKQSPLQLIGRRDITRQELEDVEEIKRTMKSLEEFSRKWKERK